MPDEWVAEARSLPSGEKATEVITWGWRKRAVPRRVRAPGGKSVTSAAWSRAMASGGGGGGGSCLGGCPAPVPKPSPRKPSTSGRAAIERSLATNIACNAPSTNVPNRPETVLPTRRVARGPRSRVFSYARTLLSFHRLDESVHFFISGAGRACSYPSVIRRSGENLSAGPAAFTQPSCGRDRQPRRLAA